MRIYIRSWREKHVSISCNVNKSNSSVGAAVVIHYLNVYNEKKHPEFYNLDDKKTPQSLFENLEIGYPFELAFIMYISLVFFLGDYHRAYVDGQLELVLLAY